MGAFERGDDAFGPAAELEGVERLLVGDGDIFDAAALVEPAMFGADAGIIEPGRDRMRLGDSAVVVLEGIGAVDVEPAGYHAVEARGVGAGRDPEPRRFAA